MTIDEAIKTNEEHAKKHHMDTFLDYYKALVLGIEALKRIKDRRRYPFCEHMMQLPGETES